MKKIYLMISAFFLLVMVLGCEVTTIEFEPFLESLPGEISGDLTLTDKYDQHPITYTYNGKTIGEVFRRPYFNKDTMITLDVMYRGKTYEKRMLVKAAPIIHDLHIETENQLEVTSKETYIKGSVSIGGSAYATSNLSMQIRGRGNSTWGFPKKPYRIKFDERQSILGMDSARDYVLLAEYTDKSLLRNYAAHYFSQFLNIGHVIETRFVSVYFNGSYQGVYLLTEQVEQDRNRLNIDVSEDLDGGFLIELETEDRIWQEGDENIDWFRAGNHNFVIKSPKMREYSSSIISGKIDYMKNYIRGFLDAIPTNKYDTYIDVDNFVDFFILSELFKQVDIGYSSVYSYKDKGELLKMGPAWDFDISSGNGDYYDSSFSGYWVDYNPWFYQLIQNKAFETKFIHRFKSLMDNHFSDLINEIDYVSNLLETEANRNFDKWQILGIYVWPNPPEMVAQDTYRKQINYLKDYLIQRKNWLYHELTTNGYYLD
jgi:hypothetical protein